MKREIILAGFGGQGIMSIGKNLVEAAVAEELEGSWLPSYGPEMRGGTANCMVILSDEIIGSPVVEAPTELVVMNRPSLEKFEATTRPGGTVFINSSAIPDRVSRTDVRAVYVPCDEIARELGNQRIGNMVMLGAIVGELGLLQPDTIRRMIAEVFTGAKATLVPLNLDAFQRGLDCTKAVLAQEI